MSSCPVCYEAFSAEEDNLIPLQLPCNDIICKRCISNDIFEGSFFCPECGFECKGDSACDIGTEVTLEEESNKDDFEEDYFVGCRDTESAENSDNCIPPAARDSLFAQFTQRTSTGGTVASKTPTTPTTSSSLEKNIKDRYGVCKDKNCQNKALGSDGHCFNHSSNKKSHLVQEHKLANLLARTSLDFVQINCNQNSFKFQSRADVWPDINPKALIERFKKQERMELGEAMALINRARDILSKESNVLKLEAPVKAVGDIHGQFYDLLNMFEVGGYPQGGSSGQPYVFLGDYVDRGSFSCEVMLTLLAFKVAYPEKVWLIRGNHECASVSGHFGFKEECKMKYGVQLYYRFLLLFQTMPLAALVTTAYGDLFLCHGGLSPHILTIEALDELDRFVEPEENSALLDILWSDPISEERVDDMTDVEYEEFISLEWRPNPTRGCSYCYGYKAVHDFLNRNSIVSLVRAHEVQENGFRKHFDPAMIESRIQQSAKYKRKMSNAVTALRRLNSDEFTPGKNGKDNNECSAPPPSPVTPAEEWHYPSHDIPTVITVFSAPNYCDRYNNQGAILKIAMGLDGFQFLQYSCVPHPVPDVIESQMTNQIMSVIQTCPYMPTSFKDFVRVAIELGHEDSSAVIEEGNENENESEEEDVEEKEVIGGLGKEDSPVVVSPDASSSCAMAPLKIKDKKKDRENVKEKLDKDKNKEPSKKSMLSKLFQSLVPNTHTNRGLEEQFRAGVGDGGRQNDSGESSEEEVGTDHGKASAMEKQAEKEGKNTARSVNENSFSCKSISPPHSPPRTLTPPRTPPKGLSPPPSINSARTSSGLQRNASMSSIATTFTATVSARSDRSDSSPPRPSQSGTNCSENSSERLSVSNLIKRHNSMRQQQQSQHHYRRATESFNNVNHPHAAYTSPYRLAHASDAINELHPVRVQKYMDNFASKKSSEAEKQTFKGFDKSEIMSLSEAEEEEVGFKKRIKYLIELFDKQAEINTQKFIKESRLGSDCTFSSAQLPRQRSASLNFIPSSPPTPRRDERASEGGNRGGVLLKKKSSKDLPRSLSTLDTEEDEEALFKEVRFTKTEVLALRLLFSLFDRSGTSTIGYEDLVAYGEETGGLAGIRDAAAALAIVDIDGDGVIGLLDFIHFAARLRDTELVQKEL